MELDIIGLKNITTASSGYYVNDLPGMATELAESVTFANEQTVEELWISVQKRSYLRLENYVSMLLADKAKLNEVILSTGNLKKYNRKTDIIAADATEFRGVYIRCPESKYASLKINSFFIYSGEVTDIVDKEFYIYDANDMSLLDTIVYTVVPGLNEVPINQEFKPGFGITAILIGTIGDYDTIRTSDDFYNFYDSDASCVSCMEGDYMDIYPTILEAGNLPDEINITRKIGKGIWVSADILCSPDSFITRNKNRFLTALLYLMGAELLKSKKGSPRLNIFTASNLQYTEELHNEFEEEWMKAAKQAISGISLTGESVCFNCDDSYSVTTKGFLP